MESIIEVKSGNTVGSGGGYSPNTHDTPSNQTSRREAQYRQHGDTLYPTYRG